LNQIDRIFERLRSGVVPDQGLDAFAVGIEKHRDELHRQLELAASGTGCFKFLRGGYGCGKTFMARLAVLDALQRGFAASFVVVSDNDLHFHKFDELYRKVMQELSTAWCEKAAMADILDRWIAGIEEALVSAGVDEEAPDFDDRVRVRLEQDLASKTGGKVPEDMVRVLRTVFTLKQEGRLADAGALLSWLSGSRNVASSVKKLAGVKGDIGSNESLDYLHGILEIVKAAGYKGLVIVIDEAETILRMKRDVREKSLNGIRQILDASDRFPGLVWIFTGTPDFFDTQRGVAGLPPLSDRIRFQEREGFVNLRQPQLQLKPFDRERLSQVALKLRELYPARDPVELRRKVSPEVIRALVDRVTEGFRGNVGVVPRHFLREFVDVMDLVGQEKDYNPAAELNLHLELTEDERRVAEGQPAWDPEPEDGRGYSLVSF